MKSFAHAAFCTTVVLVALGPGALLAKNSGPGFEQRQLDEERGNVQVLDIDRDGYNDVLKIKSQGESLAWYRFRPGGEFTKFVVCRDRQFRADRLAAADLDGDGDLDVVTGLEEEGPRVVIWLENPLPKGKPTELGAWKVHQVGPQSDYIKDIGIADFNRDGKLDIVTRTHTETAIFFQRTPEQWASPRLLGHESHEGMEVADLDRDGDPDIVLNGFWFETPDEAETGTYRKHVFDKKWFTPVDKSWRDNNAAIKIADVNGDNLPDIIISHSELPGYPISIYNASSRADVRADRWRETRVIDRFDFCQTLDAGDVDNDGDLDILAAKFERAPNEGQQWRNQPPYPVVVFRNVDGQGTTWAQEILSEDGMYAGVFGDVGSDGDLDIVGPRSYWVGPIRMWENRLCDRPLALDQFTYIQIDDSRSERYFGLTFQDFTGDGYVDIVAGKWFYRNPGGDMTGPWQRTAVDDHVDALVTLDVDGDEFGDFIGLKCDEQYWYEAKDTQGNEWDKVRIGSLPICDHKLSTQYYGLGQIVPGGRPEIVLAEYYLEVPADPQSGNWPATRYAAEGQGYAIGDIDGDGLLDIAGSYQIEGEDKVPGASNVTWWCSEMCWWRNPGDGSGDWQRFDLGKSTQADRYALADLNGDGRLDLVTTEERYPGHVANANCYWFEQPGDPKGIWPRHLVAREWSMNNLDVADMDRDGDLDIVTCEHSMPFGKTPAPGHERLQIWANDGKGHFTEHVIDRDKESHLGAQAVDLDCDGDLDIVSIAWRDFQYLHVWRNDAIKESSDWGRVAVGRDDKGHWWAELENRVLFCRYGWKPINEDKGGETFITDLTLKSTGQNQVGPLAQSGRIDACAARYEMVDAAIKHDGQDGKTVRLTWRHDKEGFTPVQEVTIFPDGPLVRIDYLTYGVNIVDIARPGGGANPQYWFYGGDRWKRGYLLYPKGYYYPPDDTYVVEQTQMPGDEGPGSLDYHGCFLMAVYNRQTGMGYGRVSPVATTSIIKLLSNRGFELFPCFRQPHQPYTGYLFALAGGQEEAMSLGRQIVDEYVNR